MFVHAEVYGCSCAPRACVREQKDAHGYLLLMRQVVHRHGFPVAVYSDQHSIFRATKTAMLIEGSTRGRGVPPHPVRPAPTELGVTMDPGEFPTSQRADRALVGHLSGPPDH